MWGKKWNRKNKISNDYLKKNHTINKKEDINNKTKKINKQINEIILNDNKSKNQKFIEKDNKIQNDEDIKSKVKKINIKINEKNKDNETNTDKSIIKKEIKEYEGKENKYIDYYVLQNYKIQPVITDSKYNVFFFIGIIEKFVDYISLSTYFNNFSYLQFWKSSYINFKSYFIDEAIIKKKTKNKIFKDSSSCKERC